MPARKPKSLFTAAASFGVMRAIASDLSLYSGET
jgi:hypothetical protein